ncbi:MAG: GntR family transcriptional regulator [Rhizobiales bacterium]|nr:GntR family transcriptional regulator [Hyphomicrobiales bacterium]
MKKINQPVWLKIANKIRQDIEAGIYRSNTKLPSLNNLAKQFEVNRNTARQALLYLQNISLISVEQGRGTYVLDKPTCVNVSDNHIFSSDMVDFTEYDEKIVSSELIIPDVKSKNIISLREEEKIWRIKSLILSDQDTVALYSCEIQSNMLTYFKGTNVLTPMVLEEAARNSGSLFRPLPTTVSAGLPEYEFKHILNLKHTIPLLMVESNYVQAPEIGGDGSVVLSFKRYFVSNRVNIKFETSHVLPMIATA